MTLLKNKKLQNIILIGAGFLVIFVFLMLSENSCGVKHIIIVNEIKSYESSLDPEFCEDLMDRIDSFNSQCNPQVEILDCG